MVSGFTTTASSSSANWNFRDHSSSRHLQAPGGVLPVLAPPPRARGGSRASGGRGVGVIDGLASNRSRTLFVIRDLFSGATLGTALLDAHDAGTIVDFMERTCELFGRPDYWVGDGQTGLIAAAREHFPDAPYQYCHRHFLANLGKALMEGDHDAQKKSSAGRASSRRSAGWRSPSSSRRARSWCPRSWPC
ncbi:MAG: hypothetical protein ACTSU5_02925 [Promethearchaeota archaeon]